MPLFAPVDRGRSGDLTAAGGLGDAAIHCQVLQQQPHDAVVGLQRDLLELGENAQLDPLVTAVADRAGRAAGIGDRLGGTAEPQNLDELVEHDPVRDTPTVAAQRMGRIERRTGRQQRGELVPQRVDKPRWQSRHGYSW
jgi:hypothetical protein